MHDVPDRRRLAGLSAGAAWFVALVGAVRVRGAMLSAGCVSVLLVAAIALWLRATGTTAVDRELARAVSHHRDSLVTHVVDAYELLLAPELVAPVIGVTCLVLAWRRAAPLIVLRGLVTVALAATCVPLLKHVAHASRPPFSLQTGHVAGLGFPSGHTTTDVAVALVAIASLGMARIGKVVVVAVAALVAAGRIYSNAHYGLDVLGGLLLGVGIAAIALSIQVPGQSRTSASSSEVWP